MNSELLDDAIDLAHEDAGGHAFLVEVVRRADGSGAGPRVFAWSAGTLLASVTGDRVRLRDRVKRGADLEVDLEQVTALAAVARDWLRLRSRWWMFQAGWASGYGAAPPPPRRWSYLPPGAEATPAYAAGPWEVTETLAPHDPVQVGHVQVERVARLVVRDQRVGECTDPRGRRDQPVGALPVGSRVGPAVAVVGQAYEAPGGLRVVARRLELEVRRNESKVTLGPEDAGLPEALLAVMGTPASGPPAAGPARSRRR